LRSPPCWRNLSKQLALDLAPEVRVNCIARGYIATDQLLERKDTDSLVTELSDLTLLRRLGTPAEVAEAVAYAAQAQFMTGAVISLDGGVTSGY
jgi:NAD(P)-dependent dehydrogenase (short-subunit alcohol dehydrogenase family)